MSDDHEMLSSDDDVSTPAGQVINPAALTSPPDSQHSRAAPIMPSSSGASANANGKRPLKEVNGLEGDDEELDIARSNNAAMPPKKADLPPQTHQASGYTWTRAEDEPGYSWLNKKAQDEAQRAWDGMVHREHMVKGKSGLPSYGVAGRRL